MAVVEAGTRNDVRAIHLHGMRYFRQQTALVPKAPFFDIKLGEETPQSGRKENSQSRSQARKTDSNPHRRSEIAEKHLDPEAISLPDIDFRYKTTRIAARSQLTPQEKQILSKRKEEITTTQIACSRYMCVFTPPLNSPPSSPPSPIPARKCQSQRARTSFDRIRPSYS